MPPSLLAHPSRSHYKSCVDPPPLVSRNVGGRVYEGKSERASERKRAATEAGRAARAINSAAQQRKPIAFGVRTRAMNLDGVAKYKCACAGKGRRIVMRKYGGGSDARKQMSILLVHRATTKRRRTTRGKTPSPQKRRKQALSLRETDISSPSLCLKRGGEDRIVRHESVDGGGGRDREC